MINTFTGLDPVTGVGRGDSGRTLQWSAPGNAPWGCISNYVIIAHNNNHITNDNGTSIPIDEIPTLDSCGDYEVMVTLVVPSIGAVECSTSDPYNPKEGQ